MYTPLYIKTDNSLQQSMIKIKDLIQYALKNNIKSLTITDNSMYGVMDFYRECKKNDIKPIIGLEITIDDKKIILYVENYEGYKNLIKLSTIASERKISLLDLEKYSNSLLCITPYDSYSLYKDLKHIFKDIYLSYKDNNEKEMINEKNKLYMNETLYINKSDSRYIKYIDSIRESIPLVDIVNTHINNYILMSDEYKEKYDIEKNKEIAELCNLEIPTKLDLTPKYINEEGIDSYTYLKKMCVEGLKKHFGNSVSVVYKDRLKYELDVINKMGFSDYFLIVSDYVKYAKENNIIVGTGRGSAVGSLVSYCLGITDADPIKYNLLFERFLNPERVSMPDIDIDFEHEKREEVINYCIEKYGKKRVVPIITFGTLGAKGAVRDVGSSMGMDPKLIDSLCKLIDSKKDLKDNYNDSKAIKDLLDRKDDLKKCYKISTKFEGLKRHTSIHAAGVVMSNIDLDEVIPLDYSHGFYVSGYDMTYLEEIGLLKMDFLAIKYLTTIHNIIDSINKEYKLHIEFDKIPLNDKKSLDVFTRADTIGIFQFESDGMINFLKKLKVSSMDDLFAAIALFRPGPMKNIPTYIDRKNGKEKVDLIDPSLESILKPTYGIMIYQEQIMQIARTMADYTLGEADILRKAMSKKKKDILLKQKEKFTERALKKGYKEALVNSVYEKMLKFAEYGFNKSHSIGYSIVAYKMAYLKAHFPKNFITYLLSQEVDSSKTKSYIYEAKKYGIEILLPDINKSDKNYVIEENGIRYPLSNIRNVGTLGSEYIINERKNGEYKDIFDFIKRCYSKQVTSKTIESLIYAGAFNTFGYNKKTLISNLDSIINYGELIKDLDREFAIEPEILKCDEYDTKEIMNQEFDMFGMYLTHNPITELKEKNMNIVNLSDVESYFDKNINIIINVDKFREVNTSKGDKMAFITGSDEVSTIDIVMFPTTYSKYTDINNNDILKINGRVEKRFDKYQIVVNELEKL